MEQSTGQKIATALVGWGLSLLMAFPILWMALAAFKTESQAIASPPIFFFAPTLENFAAVFERANYPHFFLNSVVVAGGSTLLALIIGLPAAYAMAFYPTKRTKDVLVWMLSTKMMPAVGVLVPIYLMFRSAGLIDTRSGLVFMYTLMNLPIVVWMLFTFFKDVPKEILEAALLDGARPVQQFWMLLLPLTAPGIASTGLLAVILAWNEAFWSINLSTSNATPLTAFIASFSSPEGLFWAKLSAASLLAIGPILAFGWMTQKQLVRGLTFGAVK
ncbi:carbohydrate ABC transporter permease [Sinorhizobium americanum]|uniref:Various polyols ABC transporter, permease component 2 n=1 Tax=Sinorhizobium americanum TaxID=194963 RepID=A0A1L3LSK0_9HYPH|nr:carbohydrate ABC transporter permease [Sinorhizobium americanum]APG93059.1 various polyols ABC transporter, permease component 2 [Sinorhizobium americanum]OAP35894.1 sugar ABC transporter permease [Sinorhizobium americanum]